MSRGDFPPPDEYKLLLAHHTAVWGTAALWVGARSNEEEEP